MLKDKNDQIRELLIRISEDDELAFAEFFDLYHVRMMRFSFLYVKDMQTAEDVVSEVLIQLLRNRKKLHRIEHFSAYLFAAIKNQSLNYLKQRKREYLVGTLEEEYDRLCGDFKTPFHTLVEKELLALISNVVESLPPVRKLTFQFIHEEGMTKREAAELLGISVRTVEVHVSLAVKQIRKEVQAYGQARGHRNWSAQQINSFLLFVFALS